MENGFMKGDCDLADEIGKVVDGKNAREIMVVISDLMGDMVLSMEKERKGGLEGLASFMIMLGECVRYCVRKDREKSAEEAKQKQEESGGQEGVN